MARERIRRTDPKIARVGRCVYVSKCACVGCRVLLQGTKAPVVLPHVLRDELERVCQETGSERELTGESDFGCVMKTVQEVRLRGVFVVGRNGSALMGGTIVMLLMGMVGWGGKKRGKRGGGCLAIWPWGCPD